MLSHLLLSIVMLFPICLMAGTALSIVKDIAKKIPPLLSEIPEYDKYTTPQIFYRV